MLVDMDKIFSSTVFALMFSAVASGGTFQEPPKDFYPQTWFHLIGGNVARDGLRQDLEAVAGAGIGGIQLFHGRGDVWPRTGGQIQCLSEKWDSLVGYVADECARLGLKFEMQNCPGWSMCGGPWITHDLAMRKLVCFEEGRKPKFSQDDDYREIGVVEFPAPPGFGEPDHRIASVKGSADDRVFTFEKPVTVRSIVLPNHNKLGAHDWAYEPEFVFTVSAETESGWKTVRTRRYPRGAWQDDQNFTLCVPETTAKTWRLKIQYANKTRKRIGNCRVVFSPVARLENWEALAGWCFRDLKTSDTPKIVGASGPNARKARLVFGHVNMRRRNGPAPKEATGWECDKLDPKGANAMFDAYIGRLANGVLSGGKLKGLLLDSWECNCQTWTPRLEEYFRKVNGYELRPNLPAVFGYPVADAESTEKFLRDWRRTLSRLVEENFYAVMRRRAKENNLDIQFETAFGDVVPGDAFRYWRYADIPMCEFWQPHDNSRGFVGSDDFKPVRPCVSAAHIYGKKRVAAEALTSFSLTWNEDFKLFKNVVDRHLFRGVTKMVFHTYTHNPQTGDDFLPPGTSFGSGIGSPFLRGQTWWRFMPCFTKYLARCCYMLERGKPVVDVLWLFGDDTPYRPPENFPFPEGYKYDYCNADALITRAQVKDGRIAFPDGMSYAALWIPEGTFLLPETSAKIASLEKDGAKIMRGALKIDWPSQLDKLGFRPDEWYQRRDGNEDIFFVRMKNGETAFITIKDGKKTVFDPVAGEERAAWKDAVCEKDHVKPFELKSVKDCPKWATERIYAGSLEMKGAPSRPVILSLGKVDSWAEVYVNAKKVSTLWCEPYTCDIGAFLNDGKNEIIVVVTSTWYNTLVNERDLPENRRTTWVIRGPGKNAKFVESGLTGPVTIFF